MTNFQPVRAKAPHKAVNLPDGRVVTRNGAQTVDLDITAFANLVTANQIEVFDGSPHAVGNEPPASPFVTHGELVAAYGETLKIVARDVLVAPGYSTLGELALSRGVYTGVMYAFTEFESTPSAGAIFDHFSTVPFGNQKLMEPDQFNDGFDPFQVKKSTMSQGGYPIFFTIEEDCILTAKVRTIWAEQQRFDLASGDFTSLAGYITLTVDLPDFAPQTTGHLDVTGGLNAEAFATVIQEALEALNGIEPGDIVVTPHDAEESGHNKWLIKFTGNLAGVDIPLMTHDDTHASGTGLAVNVYSVSNMADVVYAPTTILEYGLILGKVA